MRHIIDRVLELQDSDSEPPIVPAPQDGDLAELLKTLQPRIRVYGCGGCGNNTVSRLTEEGLLDDEYAVGWAILMEKKLFWKSLCQAQIGRAHV